MANSEEEREGKEAINKLKTTDPPLFLSSNTHLSLTSRIASKYLFNLLKPYSSKSPFDQLYTDGFDSEQIWQQIDLQSLPILSLLKRDIKLFEQNPDQICCLFGLNGGNKGTPDESFGLFGEKEGIEGTPDGDFGVFGGKMGNGEMGMVDDGEEFDRLSDGDDDDDDDDVEEDEEDEEEDDGDGVPEVEDEFLKVKELEKFLVREEMREYGSVEKKNKKKRVHEEEDDDDEEEDEEEESEGGEEDDELLMYGKGDDDVDESVDIRYEDFFLSNKKTPKRKQKPADESDDLEMEDEEGEQEENLSTFEKERLKIQAKIKEMEDANLKPKDWTMQGEVDASKRPKDSALEVDLDFEHNARPPPVITEEVTASLEEIIKQRITDGNFDDVQRAPKLPTSAPKERKELDDNKSKKGLAEVYEEEYAQQTGLTSAPVSHNDELKKEATNVFKRLCFKLDALSHFHFAPKPVVEDMSIQSNVPALAMEEIAPVAVSDAAMLAPEEVFAGKGDVKEETELTKEDRKRRRARKKRKIKARNAKSNRVSGNQSQAQSEVNE